MEVEWATFDIQRWSALVYVVLGGTFFAYLFNLYGITHLGPSATGAYIYTQPVFAAVIAIIFFGEHLSWQKGIAALLIFTGVFLVNLRRREGL